MKQTRCLVIVFVFFIAVFKLACVHRICQHLYKFVVEGIKDIRVHDGSYFFSVEMSLKRFKRNVKAIDMKKCIY
jgi:hypothetical protein